MTENTTTKTTGQTITIKGINYIIEQVMTPAGHRAEGRNNVAASRESNNIAADLVVRSPAGAKLHLVYQMANTGGLIYIMSF